MFGKGETMKKFSLLVLSMVFIFASHAYAIPLVGVWNLEDGIAAILDPDNDGAEIGDEAAGRDTYSLSTPYNEYYWRFDGLIRTKNLSGPINDNGDGTGSRNIEVFRTDGTFKIHGDHLWGQTSGTIYEVSIDSHFVGESFYEWDGVEWQWTRTVGTSHVWGQFNDDPFLFGLTDHVNFDSYDYSNIVGHYIYLGDMTNVVMTVSPVPEPGSILLLSAGLISIAAIARKKAIK
jgi:hypothetical protein